MKKVKIMLMSALVVAAVGGALAFKAQNFSTGLYCGSSSSSCPTQDNVNAYTTVGASATNRVANIFCSTTSTGACTYVTLENPQ